VDLFTRCELGRKILCRCQDIAKVLMEYFNLGLPVHYYTARQLRRMLSVLFVCGYVTTITRNCVHRSSPNWVCR